MVEGTKKSLWENVKFLMRVYVTPDFIKPDKFLLTRFNIISRSRYQGWRWAAVLGQESRTAEQLSCGACSEPARRDRKLLPKDSRRCWGTCKAALLQPVPTSVIAAPLSLSWGVSKSSFNYGIGRFGCLLSTSTCKVTSLTCLFGGCSCKISGFWSHSCLHCCQCREARMVWMKPKGISLLISYPEMTGRSELVSLHLPKSPPFPIPPPALGTEKPAMPESNQS